MTDNLPTYDDLLARNDSPAGSSWGLFGDNDDIGAVNLLTEASALAGASCIRSGRVFGLDLALDAFEPPLNARRGSPKHTIFHGQPNHSDDYLDGFFLQGSTQIDGLRHFRHPDAGYYNGHADEEVIEGTPTLGINRWAERGLVGRGVLIDVEAHLAERGDPIDHRSPRPFAASTLDEAAESQGLELRPGAMVLIRTGWVNHVLNVLTHEERIDLQAHLTSCGLDQQASTLRWLWDHRVPLIATDNLAVENIPVTPNETYLTQEERDSGVRSPYTGMLHRQLIPLLGIALGELWFLDDLAAECRSTGRWDFMLVAKPLNLVGGVGSPANAVAIT